ncbi:MAG TPA: hypothetical protein DCP92_10460 [Nitrospiraceae bacterium]|jgi:threonine synthase|nr:hypothetical protein [Nitrospiraceae bacterium]
MAWRGLIEEYRECLPVSDKTPAVTMQGGQNPLMKVINLQRKIGIDFHIYMKYEGANPTGSFKDSAMTIAISNAAEAHSRAVI